MRLILEKKKKKNKRSRFNRVLAPSVLGPYLKLQVAMEGTSPGSPPTGGFRKTGNSEQYAFKKVNIEEYVKVIYMNQTCCQLEAQRP